MTKHRLAIVIPCYNEEKILSWCVAELEKVLKELISKDKISSDSHVYFIDDGSEDNTWQLISKLSKSNTFVKGIKLSRNFGHQQALLAGMRTLKDDYEILVTTDVDLQDDINVLEKFIDLHKEGYEIVYGVRKDRGQDSFFKRNTALWFYRLMEILGVNIVYNHGDYRLLGRNAIAAIEGFKEANLFLRGIFPSMGFKSCTVEYDRKARPIGVTKFTFIKMLKFALDGITSFSVVPLRIIAWMGFVLFFISFVLSLWVWWTALFTKRAIQGWASSLLPMLLLGGMQTIFLGTVGEYVGRIYKEVKQRPRFIVEDRIK